MAVASANSTTTLKKEAFYRLQIEWKDTITHLPAQLFTAIEIDVLLGISW